MTKATVKQLVTNSLRPACREKDPGFEAIIFNLIRKGMLTTGTIGVVGILLYVLVKSIILDRQIVWTYVNFTPDETLILWDKFVVFFASAACIFLAYTKKGLRHGRLILSVFILLISVASLTDDLLWGKEYTSHFLVLYLTVAIGIMPYKAWQSMLFGVSLLLTMVLCSKFLPGLLDVEPLRMGNTVYLYSVLMVLTLTGISATLYSTHCEQYLSRRNVELLTQELETINDSLKRSYVSLEQTQEELIHSQKMASLARFSAGLSHELKNPLNFVNNFAVMNSEMTQELIDAFSKLARKLPQEEVMQITELLSDLKENAHHIDYHGKRADDIILKMQEYSWKSAPDLQKTDINVLLDKYVNIAKMESEDADVMIHVERTYHPQLPKADVSPNEIGHVFLNLLNNAFHAVTERATSSHETYVPKVEVVTEASDDAIEVRFKDNGGGIPSDIQKKIFEPFFSTTRDFVGLGLSVAYDIVTRRYGGSLWFETVEGTGSVFILRIPTSFHKSHD